MRRDGASADGRRQLTAAQALAILYGAVQSWQRRPATEHTLEHLRAEIDSAIAGTTPAT